LHASSIVPPYAVGMQTGLPSMASVTRPRATPWWVWFAGGALAVGLGIGGAVWYASREPARPPAAAPTLPPATGLPAVTPPVPARVVQITFASRPAAGVFAVGSSTELCSTPCTLDVDLDDGGATTHRDYVFRRAGYVDEQVRVTIDADAITVPAVELDPMPVAPVVKTDPPVQPVVKGKGRGKGKGKEPDRKVEDKKPDDKQKIDRTDTIDPFGGS
jgi:hypothetical protein